MIHDEYAHLLSGEPITIEGVGRIRQLKLSDVFSQTGCGIESYSLALYIVGLDKDSALGFISDAGQKSSAKKISDSVKDKISLFDLVTIFPSTRAGIETALSLFIDGEVRFHDNPRYFDVLTEGEITGRIDETNYAVVRTAIMRSNNVSPSKSTKKAPTFPNDEVRRKWELLQQNMPSNQPENEDDGVWTYGNIIAKVCSSGLGYTYLNIWDLTFFRLMDLFYQIGYLRSVNLNEMIFAHCGGDDFNVNAWMTPVFTYRK